MTYTYKISFVDIVYLDPYTSYLRLAYAFLYKQSNVHAQHTKYFYDTPKKKSQ